jgi:CRISPR/Cas system-associated exonuclease Cas4 (RecB family)
MLALSKSKLLAYRQCHKRLWLEMRRPELQNDSEGTEETFRTGHQLGDLARRLFDPNNRGILIDLKRNGLEGAFAETTAALRQQVPIFEAGFCAGGASTFADIMLPVRRAGKLAWRMLEVKSSTSVKDYHRDDIAVQAFVANAAGVRLHSASVVHIDGTFVYKGTANYDGLLAESDLTDEVVKRRAEVKTWIAEAQSIVDDNTEPSVRTGRHCSIPFECGFQAYCKGREPQPKYPTSLLPRVQTKALKAFLGGQPGIDLAEIPDDLLNERQQRVKSCTLSNGLYFDAAGAASDLAAHKLPAYFLDFETIQFAIPIWKGTRPYQQIPFQFSVHILAKGKPMEHRAFLDLSGDDPSRPFAEALVQHCGSRGPVFVYNAGFETARIKELAKRFPNLRMPLLSINQRVIDLLTVAEERYYHPSQEGSWSIKQVLPTIAPDLHYNALDGVQDGGMAMEAYREALVASTLPTRKHKIQEQLLAYCKLDTYAMVRIWQFFTGRAE